jgi:hypothetical protein
MPSHTDSGRYDLISILISKARVFKTNFVSNVAIIYLGIKSLVYLTPICKTYVIPSKSATELSRYLV